MAGSTRYRTETVLMATRLPSPLRVALIGMSGVGKTFWAKRLAATGRPAISCDDYIEERLRPLLATGGHIGISGVAAWMGWPNSASYPEREAAYLASEIGVLDEVLSGLERDPVRGVILDTTGSVIYSGNNILMRLRRQMTVVHLSASEAEQELLVKRYLADPKPVLWRGAYQPKPGETPRETVTRCYPALIASRRQSYVALAHCALQVEELREGALSAHAFLGKIHALLER